MNTHRILKFSPGAVALLVEAHELGGSVGVHDDDVDRIAAARSLRRQGVLELQPVAGLVVRLYHLTPAGADAARVVSAS